METARLSFGERNFGGLKLGDQRRTACLVKTADALCRHPGGTLPDKLPQPADLRAFYRLMKRPELTHATVMDGHTAATRQAIAALGSGTVLILHDGSELDYTSKHRLGAQMSQIGQGTRRGYIAHNSLAVRADTGATLGLTSQILHRRARVPKRETYARRRRRADRESRLWVKGAAASGAAPPGVLCVDVSDSLSDTFEYMAFEIANGRSFVLRQREERRLAEATAGHDRMLAAVRAQPAVGQRTLVVQAAPGRAARRATVHIAYTPLVLATPKTTVGDYANVPLRVWAVRTWETQPPKGEEPLEWILLTNVPVHDEVDAQERIDWYEKRWIIEEYHKGLKTGCRIEAMQFATIDRLEPAIAVVAAVATTLLQLRDAARAPDADVRPAISVVGADYVEVLVAHYGNRLSDNPTVREFYLHVARLGGHQNRKCDGPPGWLTLWRGWTRLQAMLDGYHARERKRKRCGTN